MLSSTWCPPKSGGHYRGQRTRSICVRRALTAKGDYDQFIGDDGKSEPWFGGFKKMSEIIERQASAVHSNPPTKLRWYFQTPKTRERMLPILQRYRVNSIYYP
ncbi:Tox-REase-5 domain-containing protein [Achromobacter pulmonis]|uniref:Tox-REase-5 domain-containing protein n=1 Tax=Achromobacter pulmonis TaxID=1389932 RepID=UPI003C769FBF